MANYTIDKFTFNGNTYVLEDSSAQRTLVSGTNIKTINNESILGSGNITVSGGTDEKLSVTQQDDTESSNIYPVLSTNSSTASKKKYSNLLVWKKGELTLGGTGSDSSKYAGGLNLYNSSGNHITLKYLTTATSNRTIYLPDKAGTNVTLACTADLDGKVSGNGEIIYGTCSTAAATRKKEVFCSYYNGLHTGMIAVVDFSYINTDAYPQLNLYTTGNGGGTKYIKENIGGTISNLTDPSSLNGTCIFVYNGTDWVLQHTDSVSGGGGGGTITGIKTTAGTHTTIDVSSGAANFNVPTKTSHLTNDSGFITTIKTVNNKSLLGSGNINTPTTFFGTCSTTASTAIKVVTCDGFELTKGAIIGILFSTANTADVPTLNINSTGSRTIYVGGSTLNATINVLKWSARTMIYFMYDGSYFRYITSIAAGDEEQPRGANTWYGTCSTADTTADKIVTCNNFVLTKGSLITISVSTANTVSDTLTLNINSTGAKDIYKGHDEVSSSNPLLWDAGEVLTFIYTGSAYDFVSRSTTIDEVARNERSTATNWINGSYTGSVKTINATSVGAAYAVAEGYNTSTGSSASSAHAEGSGSQANGAASHAEGYQTVATGAHSHAQNTGTIAFGIGQTAIGTYNVRDTIPSIAVHPNGNTAYGNYAFIVGNGTSDAGSSRSNAMTLDWVGNLVASGNITDGSGNVLANMIKGTANHNSNHTMTIGGYRLQYGTISINPSSGTSGSGTWTNPYRKDSSSITLNGFSGAPYVWTQIYGTWTGPNMAYPIDVTASSFKIRLISASTSDADRPIRWLAIGQA